MSHRSLRGFVLAVFLASAAPAAAGAEIHHTLSVEVFPDRHAFTATDVISLVEPARNSFEFSLHAGLDPTTSTPGARLTQIGGETRGPLQRFRVDLAASAQPTVTVSYGGVIEHAVEPIGPEVARGFGTTKGSIGEQGIYLTGASAWYPVVDDALVTFELSVSLPAGWDAVSQGHRQEHDTASSTTKVVWRETIQQEEIFLVASRYTEYRRQVGDTLVLVMLRTADDRLAGQYLDAAAKYLPMYEALIGPYPYAKFALVENFWETGFGMPSFALLGPQVLRFPFILHSSYPHEILHNWWGNGVYVDYESGNWSEGLTAYLADHLVNEQRGSAREYRADLLRRYADYAAGDDDFPLTRFRSRHGSSSEAVGYGKALMFFHMLRLELGDGIFLDGLRDFYRTMRFRKAGFADLRRSFEKVARADLADQFAQWTERRGAPQLAVAACRVEGSEKEGFLLNLVLEQRQDDEPFRVRVPLAVTMEGGGPAYQTVVEMTQSRTELQQRVPRRPLRVDVDPELDVFRRMAREEAPPAFSQALGAKRMKALLPGAATPWMQMAYETFARSIAGAGVQELEILVDEEVDRLPEGEALLILGWENRFFPVVAAALGGYPANLAADPVKLEIAEIPRRDHSLALVARHAGEEESAIVWIGADRPESLPGLARKLPHYHKYGYLAFEGDEPANVARGEWPVLHSPLTVHCASEAPVQEAPPSRAELGARKPLVEPAPVFSTDRMMRTVELLSSDALGGREAGSKGAALAAAHIADAFQDAGLSPGGEDGQSYFETWTEAGGERRLSNVVGVIRGTEEGWSEQSVVVGAHYDHLGLGSAASRSEDRGRLHAGADDNASGVAVLLEVARVLASQPQPKRSIVFVAFDGEEAGRLGSRHFVSRLAPWPARESIGMINLDTVGRLGAGKLLVLDAASAADWAHIFRGAGYVTGVPVETVKSKLDSSDQASFHEIGIPAVQLFSGAHLDYHRPSDRADKIDTAGLAKVAAVLREAVEYLAAREKPLATGPIEQGDRTRPLDASPGTRRAGLGTIPDYAFAGEGYRLSGVVPGSPAEACGLREGDVIVGLDSKRVRGLREAAELLSRLEPGATVVVTYLRNGQERRAEATLAAR